MLHLSQVTQFVERVQLNFLFIIVGGGKNQAYPINCTVWLSFGTQETESRNISLFYHFYTIVIVFPFYLYENIDRNKHLIWRNVSDPYVIGYKDILSATKFLN